MKNPRTTTNDLAVDLAALECAVSKIDQMPCDGENSRQLRLLDASHDDRPHAEAFIQDVFFKAYRARINSFYPLLLSISKQSAQQSLEYAAVAGVRPAGAEPLFLEQYLDRPVEQVLGVAREKIIEIGNLAPADAGQARWLITTLNAFMLGAGFSHVVFTAVPRLRNAFSRMGLPLTELADAHGHLLANEEKSNWGSYYDSGPRVFAGDLHVGEAPLMAVARQNPFLEDLCRRASRAGQAFISELVHRH